MGWRTGGAPDGLPPLQMAKICQIFLQTPFACSPAFPPSYTQAVLCKFDKYLSNISDWTLPVKKYVNWKLVIEGKTKPLRGWAPIVWFVMFVVLRPGSIQIFAGDKVSWWPIELFWERLEMETVVKWKDVSTEQARCASWYSDDVHAWPEAQYGGRLGEAGVKLKTTSSRAIWEWE